MKEAANRIFEGEILTGSEISSTEYFQVIYPLITLEHFTFIKDMFTDEQVIMRNPEKYPEPYKEEVVLKEKVPHVVHGVQAALHPFQSVRVPK